MKRLIALLITSFILYGNLAAQAPDGFQFGVGIRLGLPIGDFADVNSFGVGGELQGEYGFSKNFSAVVNAGYTNFFGKEINVGSITVKTDNLGFIPVLAGVRYYPSEKIFLGAQAGVGIFTSSGNSEAGFSWQPGIGYNAQKFQTALFLNGTNYANENFMHVGLKAILKLGGGKKD
ncbi:MAG: porin family protein [Chitinophagaceae bacterium]|nr:porin family protein [Chitinophagaceae bacterium]